MKQPKLIYIILGISLFLLSTGLSYWGFSSNSGGFKLPTIANNNNQTTPKPTGPVNRKPLVDPSLPKTEPCPLNGALFTEAEKEVWETRRPLGIMIENSLDARPQSGLSFADIVYEAVAEGGITRFMGVYHCDSAMAGNITIAPVRSARIYYVNLISEYDGLYNHVGGAGNCDDPNVDPRAKALCVIRRNNIKDLDQFGRAGDFKTCHRLANRLDKEVAYEHTMACFLEELYKVGEKWKWTNVDEKGVAWDKNFIPWKFKKPTDPKATAPAASKISYHFWDNNAEGFKVDWDYDTTSNSYKRSNGGVVSVDLNTNEPLMFSNVVVQFVKEIHTSDLEKHMLYEVIGTGKAIVFMDGVAVDATWSKPSRTARTIYKDAKGKEIVFNPGKIWISILPSANTATYN